MSVRQPDELWWRSIGDFADASDCMRQHLDKVEDAVTKLAGRVD